MARPFADVRNRIAVLGATGTSGGHLKTALADQLIGGERVALFGHARDVAVLSEYDGEARLVQPAGNLDAAQYAAVFVCEPGHDVGSLVAAAHSGTLVVDLSGAVPGAWLAGTPAPRADARLITIPHPITLILEPVLAALNRALSVSGLSAFVLRPASDFGEPGLEELREQTVHLLRFESTPTDVFGRQLAFSVIPEHLFPSTEDVSGHRIVTECRALLGVGDLRFALSMALVPTFLGHSIAIHVELARGGSDEARAALAAAPGLQLGNDPEIGTSLDAPDEPGILVARVEDSGPGVVRLWVLGSDAGAIAAVRALRVASEAGVFVNAS